MSRTRNKKHISDSCCITIHALNARSKKKAAGEETLRPQFQAANELLLLALAVTLLIRRRARTLLVFPIRGSARFGVVLALLESGLTLGELLGRELLARIAREASCLKAPADHVRTAIEDHGEPLANGGAKHALVVEIDQEVDDLGLELVAFRDIAHMLEGLQHAHQLMTQPVFASNEGQYVLNVARFAE